MVFQRSGLPRGPLNFICCSSCSTGRVQPLEFDNLFLLFINMHSSHLIRATGTTPSCIKSLQSLWNGPKLAALERGLTIPPGPSTKCILMHGKTAGVKGILSNSTLSNEYVLTLVFLRQEKQDEQLSGIYRLGIPQMLGLVALNLCEDCD